MKLESAALAVIAGAFVAAMTPAAGAAGAAPGPGPARGPFEEELARQAGRLEARAGKPEAIAPLAALAVLDETVPASSLEPLLRRAAEGAADPLVAAQAAYELGRALAQRGDTKGAAAARAPLGLFTRYWVVGPFGEGRSSFAESFPPESERDGPDPARRYPGKAREVGWRAADAAVRDGVLFVDGLLRPDSQAAAYALAFARSDREQAVALRFGAPGPVKIWVNGALVHARDAVHAPSLDQDAAGARLRKGWNRILVKTVITDGAWRLFLRVTDPAGRALPGVINENPGSPPPLAAVAKPARAKLPVVTLEAALRKRAARAPKGAAAAEAWLDLGRFLAWSEPGDRDAREAAAALESSIAARPSAEALLLLADVARDDDERRRALERALALAPARSPARALAEARLGDVARSQRRDAVALARWREALEDDPACWPAALALADEEQAAGLPLLAVARAEAMPAPAREAPRVRRALARLLEGAGRQRDADRLTEELGRERRRDVELLHQLAGRARARGDGRLAAERLAAAAAQRPDLPSLATELARALEGAGDRDGAVTVATDLAARLPDDVAVRAHLGKLLHRLGRRDEALAHLRAAVALRPQDPDLRRYTERLAAPDGAPEAPGEDLARRYAAAALPMVDAAAREAGGAAAAGKGGDAVVLLDRRVVRVHKNGLSQTFAQRLVQVLTDHGADENKEFFVRYTPGSEEVEIRQARIYRRGARGEVEVVEATDRDDQDLSEPWYGLYYDNRAEVVRFEGLRAGDVLEIQYLVDDVSSENQMADYFGDLQYIAEGIPKRRWDYTLIAPQSRPMYANAPRVAHLARQTTEEGGERVYAFSATDVAKIDAEPAMPGLAEVAPYLHVSTYASWAEVGTWYWRLVEGQLTPDEELRRAVRGAVSAGMSERERVRAIHNLVVTGTRYVGLEFGIHGFQPYKVTQVLARRFGDCKDKASLMVAMLREAGIDSELVLVRTRRGGRIDAEPASLAVFDHAIVYVPKLDVYLDGTAEFSGMADLPTQDQGVMVLRVGPRGSTLAETPVLPSSNNRVQRRWQVELAAGGDARVTEDLVIQGQAAPDWREHYQTPGERSERYGKVWTARYPGARLTSIDMPRIEERNAPVSVRAVAEVPRFGQPPQPSGGAGAGGGGGGLLLPVTVREADFARTYARLSARKQDLVIAYPWQHDEELTYRLPEGWRLQGPPLARELAGPFGRFKLEVAADGPGRVRVRSFLDVTQFRIAPEDYARFRAFLGEIDGALGERVMVGPGAGAGAGAGAGEGGQ